MSSINIDLLIWTLHLARLVLYPSHYLLDHLLSLYTPTCEDDKNGGIPFKKKLILSPLYVLLLILLLPIVIIFFPIRCFILTIRDPYTISVKFSPYTSKYDLTKNDEMKKKSRFGIATGNVCLLPEFMSRFNHLKNVGGRSRKIGERIVVDQFYGPEFYAPEWNSKRKTDPFLGKDKLVDNDEQTKDNLSSDNLVPGNVSTRFSEIDFFYIQEAWTSYYNKALIQELHKVFPYIVHDAGVHSFSNNRFTLNSGLLVASRYPLAAVDFKSFDKFCKHGGLLSQGVLMVKVYLGERKDGRRRVGYLFNTHMQSYQEDEIVIPDQMDEILQYTQAFMSQTRGPNDDVLFGILCGDFNCDNMSPGDKETHDHRLFDVFTDYGRVKPGLDKDWAVGTELRQRFQFEPMMSTPQDMKTALLDPSHRRQYVIDADIEEHSLAALVHNDPPCDDHGNVLESPIGGKRRIDLITTHKDYPVKVESYSFVTRLATLTDHIPVQMEFSCGDHQTHGQPLENATNN